ncbi:MAG: ComEA family DNA-binding protein [Holophagae bacterium]
MSKRLIVLSAVLATALAVTGAAADGNGPGVVNINTANAEQLQLLPRVGPALASRIMDFREASGPFRSVDEIVAVKGIGERALAKLRPYITINGATTLSEKVSLPRSPGGQSNAD